MKSYTDIEQSKKLAEILPIDSADMYYPNRIDIEYQSALPIEFKLGNPLLSQEISCWSLAALLDVLPHRIDDRHALVSGKLSANEGWCVCYDDDNGDIDYYFHNSNLIDACYEMIMKLHEQKLL